MVGTDLDPASAGLAEIRRGSDLIHDAEDVGAAYDRLAEEVNAELAHRDPLVCCLLMGGIVPAGQLLTRFSFRCQLGYLHATRYRGATSGGELHWLARPFGDVKDRPVLVIDDILDEGTTLAVVEEVLRESGASAVYKAVLVK